MDILPVSFLDSLSSSISSSLFSVLQSITSAYSTLSFSARSIETLAPSAISEVTFSHPKGITDEYISAHSSYTVIQVVLAQISMHTTHNSFCLLVKTASGAVIRLG
jgi:hypothetical protein